MNLLFHLLKNFVNLNESASSNGNIE